MLDVVHVGLLDEEGLVGSLTGRHDWEPGREWTDLGEERRGSCVDGEQQTQRHTDATVNRMHLKRATNRTTTSHRT